ncbi:CYTH domain-containing protein [Cyanobium sp. CH-040]|uniref:CYTH domain-containing protein n=1 Tax=Cyanobium sp. CH-040 TaxID=2823708 RepID=UPI0020CF37EA|nr:CYTH domain-containing protein [Cyanobium sp. CH-040]MCP9926766.1 CYTH domain-containing protein [Cyanobium sp. CH-040]
MGLEIERRFLVVGGGWRRHVRWQGRLQQGYLAGGADGFTLRVRLSSQPDAPEAHPRSPGADAGSGDGAWLTIKAPATAEQGGGEAGPGSGLVRQEFEYAIPAADAAALLALTTQCLSKRRHGLDLEGGDWVVDVFEGANAPLVVAEVELSSPGQAVTLPDWCGPELTGRHELSNAALAHSPLACWPPERRDALLQALGSNRKIS